MWALEQAADTKASAHRFLHERADPCLFGGRQLLQSEDDRPHGAFVEVRRVAEAERRVPRFELLRRLEEAHDLAVLGIRGHPVPGSRREGWRAGFDDRVEPLGHGAIRLPHLGDLREHGAFPVRLVRARAPARGGLPLLDVLLHRGSFLVREPFDLLVGRRSALGGLLRVPLWAHRNLLKSFLIVVQAKFSPGIKGTHYSSQGVLSRILSLKNGRSRGDGPAGIAVRTPPRSSMARRPTLSASKCHRCRYAREAAARGMATHDRSAPSWYAMACRSAWTQLLIFASMAVTLPGRKPRRSARRPRIGTSIRTE